MSMLALGFAGRVDRVFAWANLSDASPALEGTARRMFEQQSEGRRIEHATLSGRRASGAEPLAIELFVTPDPGSKDLEGRLQSFLTLPELFQTLLSRTISPEGAGVILLTNVDAVSSAAGRRPLELPELHETLHREGVTLLATYRGTPPESLARAFDEVFRVEHLGKSWPDALLTAAQGDLLPGRLVSRPLRECWYDLGLSPGLLPE